jgi:ABC-type glutathione transport system ATPase component
MEALERELEQARQFLEEARQREEQARMREEDAQRHAAEISKMAEEMLRMAEDRHRREQLSRERDEEHQRRIEEATKKADEATRLAEEATKKTEEAKGVAEEACRREEEALEREKEIKQRAEQERAIAEYEAAEMQRILDKQALFLSKGIQPVEPPTAEEFEAAKARVEYRVDRLHFAICGGSGTGKSSLINAIRGLQDFDSTRAAPTGIVETTMDISPYPDPRNEHPYSRFIWFDVPGAGTLEISDWQYFNQQGLFIFDAMVLVYDDVRIRVLFLDPANS